MNSVMRRFNHVNFLVSRTIASSIRLLRRYLSFTHIQYTYSNALLKSFLRCATALKVTPAIAFLVLALLEYSPELFLFLCAIASVFIAAGEVGNEIAFCKLSVFGACGAGRVGVEEVLGDHG